MPITKTRRFFAVAGAFFLMMCAAIVSNTATYFITAVTDDFGCTHAQFSLYFTFVRLALSSVSLLMGVFMHRFRLRHLLLLGSVGASLGFFLLSRMQGLPMLYGAAILIGACNALTSVPIVMIVNAWCPDHPGLPMGIVMASTGLFSAALGVFMPAFIQNLGWRAGYLLLAGIYITVSLLATALVGKDLPGVQKAEKAAQRTDRKAIIFSPVFLVQMVTFFIMGGCVMISQHMSAHMEYCGLSIETISLAMSIFGVAMIFTKILLGSLYDRCKPLYFIPIILVLGGVGYVPFLFGSAAGMIAGVIAYSISAAIGNAILPLIFREVHGREAGSELWGIAYAVINLGQGIGSPLYGAVYDACGTYNPAILFSALVMPLFALFHLFVLKKRKKTL